MKMTENKFEQLITHAESEILDFKQEGYDLQQKKGRNAFTKDVLAMANTPREQSACIVFGVKWTPESGSVVVGLNRQLDDVGLQNAFRRDRIQPTPGFIYTPLEFKGKQVGVLEIPVSNYGPCTSTIDLDEKIQAGKIYYRSGTKNDIATGIKIKEIVNWFQNEHTDAYENKETNSWHQFLNTVRYFEQESAYLLTVDRITSDKAPIYALGMIPWRAVIDFDPDSEVSGFLNYVAGTLERHRVIHRTVRGQYQIQPEPGTHWFFARGLSGRENTLIKEDNHNTWLRAYKRELGKQLELIAGAISPSPVIVVVLWSEVNLRNYLRTLLEELHGEFGNAVKMIVVSDDEQSFRELVEEQEASFVRMSLRSLCHGVQDHYADLHNGDNERYILPSPSGAPIEVMPNDWLWIRESLELMHRSIGLHGGDDDALTYRLGADISWRNLHFRHDCDRDITAMIHSQVESDLKKRQIVRVNIYHSPGSGGTTVGKRVAWDLHRIFPVGILRKCTPEDAVNKIAKIAALTENSVLVIVDGGQHSDREIDDLYELLKARQTPVVLLQVLRRFKQQKSGKRQFWLDAKLTNNEADRFREVYSKSVPEKREQLAQLARRHSDPQRSAFFFGLTAYGSNFRGLRRYVRDRIAELTDGQCRILVYTSIAHYYGQQSIPAQAFGSILHLPPSRIVQFSAAFVDQARQSLDLLVENKNSEWRTAHHLIALEIMQQCLAPQGSQEYDKVWQQNLSIRSKDFINFCRAEELPISDRLLELIRRVFIYRDNNEMIGTERVAQNQFSQLIEDIPSSHGKIEVLRHLTECFPMEAHFHAHMGRLLSQYNEHSGAIECIDYALSMQSDDHVLHHMRGMVLRQRMKTESEVSVEQLIDTANKATESFEEARRLHPDQAHSYISEVQMLIQLVDQVAGKRGRDVINDVLTRPNTNPFLRRALERAEDLLDQVDHLYAGEPPSSYVTNCRARLQIFYGNFQKALQAWDNLLSRPEVAKSPIRRQIVWTILRRHTGNWMNVSDREKERIRRLLEENLSEDAKDSTSLRLWIRAIRYTPTPPSLDSIIEKIGYWKTNTGVLEAAYYLYVLHMLRALSGSTQGVADAERALDECRMLARFRRDRTRSFEWIGSGKGISGLVHQSRLGDWVDNFWESTDALVRVNGRISSIDAPQKGFVELNGGIKAFFVPAKSGFQSGRDENVFVHFYLGFSYDGPRAWDVQRVE